MMSRLPALLAVLAGLVLWPLACVPTPTTPEDPDSDDEPGDGDSIIVNLDEVRSGAELEAIVSILPPPPDGGS